MDAPWSSGLPGASWPGSPDAGPSGEQVGYEQAHPDNTLLPFLVPAGLAGLSPGRPGGRGPGLPSGLRALPSGSGSWLPHWDVFRDPSVQPGSLFPFRGVSFPPVDLWTTIVAPKVNVEVYLR